MEVTSIFQHLPALDESPLKGFPQSGRNGSDRAVVAAYKAADALGGYLAYWGAWMALGASWRPG